MENIKDDTFTTKDISSLLNAINHFRAREGSFSSMSPLVEIIGKLNEAKSGINVKEFSSVELKLLLETIDENIGFVSDYNYEGLTRENASRLRNDILVPLSEVRKKVFKKINQLV